MVMKAGITAALAKLVFVEVSDHEKTDGDIHGAASVRHDHPGDGGICREQGRLL